MVYDEVYVIFTACIEQTSCESCLAPNATIFLCKWCPKLSQCSDGMDRKREIWHKKCASNAIKVITNLTTSINLTTRCQPRYQVSTSLPGVKLATRCQTRYQVSTWLPGVNLVTRCQPRYQVSTSLPGVYLVTRCQPR